MRWGRVAFEVLLVGALLLVILVGKLEQRAARNPILPHYSFVDSDELIEAQGTWMLLDETSAWPNQTTTITCEKTERRCYEASAVLAKVLLFPVSISPLRVERWSDNEIRLSGNDGACWEMLYTLDIVTRTVSGFGKRKSGCEGKSTRRMLLGDGYKESMKRRHGSFE